MGGYGGYGPSRFDDATAFGSSYTTPGWQRAQTRRGRGGYDDTGQRYGRREGEPRRAPLTIEGELVAKATGTVSPYVKGDRVFHQKFGYGDVVFVEGNKLIVQFDKAGEKRVVDSFVQRA
jgi:DNA helicase-2/ATP-dependent DNA helicase PcrA